MARINQDVMAEDARRALSDPAIQAAIVSEEIALVTEIANYNSNGSPESDNELLEMCRELQTINRLKRRLGLMSDISKLTEAQRVKDV